MIFVGAAGMNILTDSCLRVPLGVDTYDNNLGCKMILQHFKEELLVDTLLSDPSKLSKICLYLKDTTKIAWLLFAAGNSVPESYSPG